MEGGHAERDMFPLGSLSPSTCALFKDQGKGIADRLTLRNEQQKQIANGCVLPV